MPTHETVETFQEFILKMHVKYLYLPSVSCLVVVEVKIVQTSVSEEEYEALRKVLKRRGMSVKRVPGRL